MNLQLVYAIPECCKEVGGAFGNSMRQVWSQTELRTLSGY